MLSLPWERVGPIAIDIGSSSIKAVQLTADRSEIVEAAESQLPISAEASDERDALVAEALRDLLKQHRFRGTRAVMALGFEELIVQNIRISPIPGKPLSQIVFEEAKSRANVDFNESEVRFLEAGIVQQGEMQRQEVVLMAARNSGVMRRLRLAELARLTLIAVDAEPLALVRAGIRQYRRQTDQNQTMMFVHVGVRSTLVVTVRNERPLFAKYLPIAGRDFDQALARQFEFPIDSARSLRRTYGDRRKAERDPDVVAAVQDCLRPVWSRWLEELSRCVRYCNVTFRGQPLEKIVISGGEATGELKEQMTAFFDVPVEILDCFRAITCPPHVVRSPVWDIALGLAFHSGKPGAAQATPSHEFVKTIDT